VRVSHFTYVRSLGDVRSLGPSAAFAAEAAARGLVGDQGLSAIPERSPVQFRGEAIILNFDHYAVFATSSTSVLKLRVDYLAIKVPALLGRSSPSP
jgi:hypothetical protein